MAEFFDKSFEELMEGAPKVVRNGFMGTRMVVYPDPAEPNEKATRGVIVEYNSTGKVMGTWPIRKGRAYRGTPNKVKSLSLIEADNNFPRRYCREYGFPLHSIVPVKRGEKVYPGGAGPGELREDDQPVKWLWLYAGPGERSPKLFIIADEIPATYKEFAELAEKSRR